MIKIIERNNNSISAFLGEKLITKQGYRLEDGTLSNDDDILIALEELAQEKATSLPDLGGFFMTKDIPGTNFMVTRIDRRKDLLKVEITGDNYTFQQSIWNARLYIKRFAELNKIFQISDLYTEKDDDPLIVMEYTESFSKNTTIRNVLFNLKQHLIDIKTLVELELRGFKWKEKYEKDELIFCKEVLTPLFRKMKLTNLQFTHGVGEHGKDYVFSEFTKLGTIRYCAIQVKAGNLDGKILGKLNEIIAQVEDAFTIPFEQVNDREQKYIDTFYVVTSGKITREATTKIKEKIRSELKGSIKFLDQNAVLNLINKYWIETPIDHSSYQLDTSWSSP